MSFDNNILDAPGVRSALTSSAILKVERAAKHFDELDRLWAAHREQFPFSVTKEDDPETGDLLYRIRIPSPIPTTWGLIVGDVVHNLRTALDHLAYQAVLHGGGTPNQNTMFPFARKKDDLAEIIGRRMAGSHAVARKLVEELEPYAGGSTPLWQLHQLDIIDKHRLLLVVGAAHESVTITQTIPIPGQSEPVKMLPLALRPADNQFPIEDGAVLFSVRKRVRDTTPITELAFTLDLAFGDGGSLQGEPVGITLNGIRETVMSVIARFAVEVLT